MQNHAISQPIKELSLLCQGKVREVYHLDAHHLLLVASDRISAFDVILPSLIPDKGRVLTELSRFWFEKTKHIVPNHITHSRWEDYLPEEIDNDDLRQRSMIVRRTRPLAIEAVVRGYLIGSAWKDYQESGAVCGITLPADLRLADQLLQPIFTPATKAAAGDHDENIDFERCVDIVGQDLAERVRDISLKIYMFAAQYAKQRGIILADVKFEFGLTEDNELILIDELLTPDSSRYWSLQDYRPGISPQSFDKQFIRDYLETLDWDKTAPGPVLPEHIIRASRDKYLDILDRLTRPLY